MTSNNIPLPVFRLRPDNEETLHCANFLSSDILAAGSRSGNLFLWNLKTNRIQQKISIGTSTILNVSHHEDLLFSQEKEGVFKIWNRNQSEYVENMSIDLNYCGFCRFAQSSEDKLIFAPKSNASLSILDFCGNITTVLKPNSDENLGEIMCTNYVSFGGIAYVLCSYESGDVKLWDLKMNKVISSLKLNDFIVTLDVDVGSERGICGSASENIQVFDIHNQMLSFKRDIKLLNPGCNMLRIRQDKKIFASAGWDGQVRIFSWKTLKPLAILSEHKKAMLDVVYSDCAIPLWNAPIMAAVSLDSSITLWNIYPPEIK